MNKYLVRNFKWIENLGKVPAKVYRLETGKQYDRVIPQLPSIVANYHSHVNSHIT